MNENNQARDYGDRVAGKVALVTGGASGLGLASARLLARHGARVAISDLNLAGATEAAQAINEELAHDTGDNRAIAIPHDVSDEAQWIDCVGQTVAAFGHLDILLNSAGISSTSDIESTSLEEWRRVHAVNLDGTFLGCKHGISAMKKTSVTRGGSIINISSIYGIVGGQSIAAYNSSKGGVRLLTKSVALDCARLGYNIRCNSVHPSYMDTPMVQAIFDGSEESSEKDKKIERRILRQIPLGRLGVADDVARGVLYLASDDSAFMTGSEFVIDGGTTAV